jgi:hypothetical protein
MKKMIFSIKLTFIFLMISSSFVIAQTLTEQQEITKNYDHEKLVKLQSEFQKQAKKDKQKALEMAKVKGWSLTKTFADGSFAELQRISPEGYPIYYATYNVAAARSTRANHLNSGGSLGLNLNGQNMTAHVWDGGHARVSHQEYDGPGGNNRVTVEDAASEGGTRLNFHAAHVTGTIMASGVQAAAKGMAPQARVRGYMWNNDVAEATAAANNGMLVSNHSYGYRSDLVPDYYFGAYIGESRNWDQVMFNAPNYLMVVAAGNDGNNNSSNGAPLNGNSSYDKLTGHSTSKNNLVVANAQDANVAADGTLNSVSINSSSSEGPTDDLRIKPDITGNGTSLYSTYESSNTAYASITGTSMASPNVAGTLLLLQQHHNNINGSFMRAATLKGLALHTADDIGPNGPDPVHGWGLLNAKSAAQALSANGNQSKVEELSLTNGQTYSITVNSDGSNPLLASISWTDRPGTSTTATNNSSPVLVNDLDIRVSSGSTTYNPYRLTSVTTNGTGDNNVDPYERVDINGASGTYTITVTHKGSLTGGSQNFSLVVTGITSQTQTCDATTPAGLGISGVSGSGATASWNTVAGTSYDVRYRATGTSSWTTNSTGGTSYVLSGLAPNTTYEVRVRSKCPDNSTSAYSASVNFTTTDVQIEYCDSNGNSTNDEYISNVELGGINNTSGAGAGGYSDFTAQSTDLELGSNNTIAITPTWTGTVYAEGYSVWIDYNQDGDFTDSGEQVWTLAATTDTPVNGSFTVPASALEGATTMRVSMKYNAVPTSCESFAYGEVEDYTVNITTDGGGGGGNGCAGGISSFPYNEGFENSLGAWTQSSDDDINWTVDANGTPSNGTGPAGASQGSYYIYVEASGNGSGYPNKRAILNSPCFDLSGMTTANFSFQYHMYGASAMGSIAVDASSDGGNTWTTIWSESGNQGNSWLTASIDLNAYTGNTVQLRFNRLTASTWQADIAIDDVSLSSSGSGSDICDGVSEWSSGTSYSVGDRVTYQGSLFERTASGWTNLGVCGTTNSTAYVAYNTAEIPDNSLQVRMYPNPVSEGVINIQSNITSAATYKIYNTLGQVISKGNFSNSIDVSSLQSGMYLLEINTEKQNITKRFVKK